jgi:hypothetical protein
VLNDVFQLHTLYAAKERQVNSFFSLTRHIQFNTIWWFMRKDAALSFRIPRRLKTELEQVAAVEGRSLAQVCEALLSGGLEGYRKAGPKYLQRFLSHPKKTPEHSE